MCALVAIPPLPSAADSGESLSRACEPRDGDVGLDHVPAGAHRVVRDSLPRVWHQVYDATRRYIALSLSCALRLTGRGSRTPSRASNSHRLPARVTPPSEAMTGGGTPRLPRTDRARLFAENVFLSLAGVE